MSKPRFRIDDCGMYYHCFNRISGMPHDYPFGDVDKEKMWELFMMLSQFYLIEPLSFVCMSNHYHSVLYAPPEDIEVSPAELQRRWRRFKSVSQGDIDGGRKIEPDWSNPKVCKDMIARLRDFSRFIGDFQQYFTHWFNRRIDGVRRRGKLWQGRFKDTILGDRQALWSCMLYNELNPMRAHMVKNPADYRHCSFGRFCGSGRHPFEANIARHLRAFPLIDNDKSLRQASDQKVCQVLMEEFSEIFRQAAEYEFSENSAAKEDWRCVTLARRCRYFCDGGILGSRDFVRDAMSKFYDAKAIARRRLKALKSSSGRIYSLRRLLGGT